MTTLQDLVDNKLTDKNTSHSYLPIYDMKFAPYKNTATRILEIGVWEGGSLKLWNDYFPTAHIYGLDIKGPSHLAPALLHNPRIHLLTGCDAYSQELVEKFRQVPERFDIIIDDGPHTLESMKFTANQWVNLLKPNGLLVIEDLKSMSWVEEIRAVIPREIRASVEVYDRSRVKGRFDDIILMVDLAC